MRPAATRRGASPLRPLLLLLPLVLTLAAHATVGAGVGRQNAMGGTTPQTWLRLRRPDAESLEGSHPSAAGDHKVPDGSLGRDKGDDGRPDEPDMDCKSRSAGEGQVPCKRQPADSPETAGSRSSWLRHYLRAARYLSERRPMRAASSGKGEEICLKEEMTDRPRSLNHREIEGEYSDLFDEGTVNLDEMSKLFCSSGSIVILSASLKRNSTDLSGILKLKVQCTPTNFTGSRESMDGKNCYSWSKNRNFTTFMDIIMTYITNGWRRNGHHCFPADNKNAPISDFDDHRGKASECNITKSLPKFVNGIRCRYDLIEGAVNDIGKTKTQCEKSCKRISGRNVCSCPDLDAGESSMADKENDTSVIVRYCKPLLDPTEKECPRGYDLDMDSRVCVDIDECEEDNGGCSHECANTNGGFRCKCPPKHFLMEDQKRCDTKDECAVGEDGRTYAGCGYKCTNLPNGYQCECPQGFMISRVGSCIHLKDNYTLTEDGAYYPVPTVPASEGKCPKGFTLDANNVTCTDIDECRQNISFCDQECENLYGGYKCHCRLGFYLMKDRKSCKDIDECRYEYRSGCQHKCVNTEGSYRCECPYGYRLREDQKSCEDINECRDKTAGCSGRCKNTPGSYKCLCDRGFYLLNDHKTCEDLDECELGVSGCKQDCENTAGSFRCKCRRGYALAEDQMSCRDIDECHHNVSGCAHDCENTVGSYRCSCRRGYFLMEDGRSCDTRDECAPDRTGRMNAPCSHYCTNLANGFQCTCPPGYIITGKIPGLCEPLRGYDAVGGGQTRAEGADLS